MAKPRGERAEQDPEDGLIREIVGKWSVEKHARLRRYVHISGPTRRQYTTKSQSTFVDLYCGPGRARIREDNQVVDGSAMVAVMEGQQRNAPFGQILLGDFDKEKLDACTTRLKRIGVHPTTFAGEATKTADEVRRHLNPYGLHLAFLDPYSIAALPFQVIESLAQVKRMDLIIHFAQMDLQRNFQVLANNGDLDAFAPGWTNAINTSMREGVKRVAYFNYWRSLIEKLGYEVSDNVEKVTGSHNQPLYYLVLASRHKLGTEFWSEISEVEPQQRLF